MTNVPYNRAIAAATGNQRQGTVPAEVNAGTGLIERYLEHVRVEKRLAQRTVELYALDLQKLSHHAAQAEVELLQVQTPTSGAGWLK